MVETAQDFLTIAAAGLCFLAGIVSIVVGVVGGVVITLRDDEKAKPAWAQVLAVLVGISILVGAVSLLTHGS